MGAIFNSNLIFESEIESGTILFKPSSPIYGNQNVKINCGLSKIRKGIKITLGSQIRSSAIGKNVYLDCTAFDMDYYSPFYITIDDLKSGKSIYLCKSKISGTSGIGPEINGSGVYMYNRPVELSVKKQSEHILYFELYVSNIDIGDYVGDANASINLIESI
ncbi:hypothetical protein [Levilactobacillus brevis]|uniref:hypothetical protein n=1 Tax=Levilactobacillus brevis TaxID=1580 RepID=UPI001F48B4D0|nr:hypothetical protein [Levilactobacillus brevis]MCE6027503.1 hypothetical protein [Levilactobacillus brevis]